MEALRLQERKGGLRYRSAQTWCVPRTCQRGWSRRKPSINRSRLSTTTSDLERENRMAEMICGQIYFLLFPHQSDKQLNVPTAFVATSLLEAMSCFLHCCDVRVCVCVCNVSAEEKWDRSLGLRPWSNVRQPGQSSKTSRSFCCCTERPCG